MNLGIKGLGVVGAFLLIGIRPAAAHQSLSALVNPGSPGESSACFFDGEELECRDAKGGIPIKGNWSATESLFYGGADYLCGRAGGKALCTGRTILELPERIKTTLSEVQDALVIPNYKGDWIYFVQDEKLVGYSLPDFKKVRNFSYSKVRKLLLSHPLKGFCVSHQLGISCFSDSDVSPSLELAIPNAGDFVELGSTPMYCALSNEKVFCGEKNRPVFEVESLRGSVQLGNALEDLLAVQKVGSGWRVRRSQQYQLTDSKKYESTDVFTSSDPIRLSTSSWSYGMRSISKGALYEWRNVSGGWKLVEPPKGWMNPRFVSDNVSGGIRCVNWDQGTQCEQDSEKRIPRPDFAAFRPRFTFSHRLQQCAISIKDELMCTGAYSTFDAANLEKMTQLVRSSHKLAFSDGKTVTQMEMGSGRMEIWPKFWTGPLAHVGAAGRGRFFLVDDRRLWWPHFMKGHLESIGAPGPEFFEFVKEAKHLVAYPRDYIPEQICAATEKAVKCFRRWPNGHPSVDLKISAPLNLQASDSGYVCASNVQRVECFDFNLKSIGSWAVPLVEPVFSLSEAGRLVLIRKGKFVEIDLSKGNLTELTALNPGLAARMVDLKSIPYFLKWLARSGDHFDADFLKQLRIRVRNAGNQEGLFALTALIPLLEAYEKHGFMEEPMTDAIRRILSLNTAQHLNALTDWPKTKPVLTLALGILFDSMRVELLTNDAKLKWKALQSELSALMTSHDSEATMAKRARLLMPRFETFYLGLKSHFALAPRVSACDGIVAYLKAR